MLMERYLYYNTLIQMKYLRLVKIFSESLNFKNQSHSVSRHRMKTKRNERDARSVDVLCIFFCFLNANLALKRTFEKAYTLYKYFRLTCYV